MGLGGLCAGVATALALSVFAVIAVDGLWRPDAFDYAQIARELVAGNGFASRQIIYELHLRFLETHGLLDGSWPNLHRFPLPSAAMAAWFLLVGVGDRAVVLYGVLFHALTSGLLFVWAQRAVGLPAAIATSLLFTANGVMLETGCAGLAEPPAMFFFTLSLFCLWRPNDLVRPRRELWAGATLALASLARTGVVTSLPAFLLGMIFGHRSAPDRGLRARASARFLLGFVLTMSPWLLRNQVVAGSPLFSLHSYFLLPAGTGDMAAGSVDKWDASLPWVRDFVSPVDFAWQHRNELWKKWRRNTSDLLHDYPAFGGTRLLPLLAPAAMWVFVGHDLHRIAWIVGGSFLLNAVVVSFTDMYFDKYYFHLLPALILLAVAVLWRMSAILPSGRARTTIFLAVIVSLTPWRGVSTAVERVRMAGRQVVRAHMQYIDTHTPANAVIFSDQSYAVTWMTGRRSIRRHIERRQDGRPVLSVLRFHSEYVPIGGVYLSRFDMRDPRIAAALENLEEDARFRAQFPHRKGFRDGAVFYHP